MPETPEPSSALDIIVPVHGGWKHVQESLASLEQQDVAVNVIVVDDCSPDDTLSRIRERFTSFVVLANDTNVGFAATCNRGIRAGSADVVVLLNSDVVVRPTFARDVLERFAAAPADTGSVAPILLAPDGSVDSFGITADVTLAGFVRYHGAPVERVDADHPLVLGPYGAAAAYRRAALDDVGLLDENIFMYGEELELAYRLRAGRWGAVTLPSVVGTHIGGASAGRESERQRYLSGFGRAYVLRVYGVLRTRHALRTLVTESIVVVARMITRRDVASLHGRWSGWHAARGVSARDIPMTGIDRSIGLRRSFQMRGADYWRGDPD